MGKRGGRHKCYRCGELKPADQFSWRRKERNELDTFCRPCRAAYKREHYRANRERYIDQAARSKRRLTRERTMCLLDYFANHPCVDCGETDPVVLEFDHLDPELKEFNIGQALSRKSWENIVAEIEKCEVVCANCHRRRTSISRSALRAVLTQM
jgi:hypothetical protein